METRTCRKCLETKDLLSGFPRRYKSEDVSKRYGVECKKCYAAYMRAYVASHPEYRRQQNEYSKQYAAARPTMKKRTKLRLNFGMTLERYQEMLAEQGGVCAICRCGDGNVDKRSGKNRDLSVDHCHETDVIRGLLCGDCNRSLGLLKENLLTMKRMMMYLMKSATRHAKAA